MWIAAKSAAEESGSFLEQDSTTVDVYKRQQLALVRAYVKDNFVDKGMCADFAIPVSYTHLIKIQCEILY